MEKTLDENKNKNKHSSFIKSKSFKGFLACIAALLLLIYFAYNFLISSNKGNDIVTQTAVLQTIYKSVTADMYFMRDEQMLSADGNGNVVSAVDNGVKVAGGDTVAYVLDSAADSQLIAKKAILENEIKYYESVNSASSTSLITDIQQDNKRITDGLNSLLDDICRGNIKGLYANSKLLREYITGMQIDTGTAIDVTNKLNELKAEYNAIDASTMGKTALKTDKSGYFFSFADGYEGKADYENVLKITSADVDNYINAAADAVPSSVYGKIITQFAWYAVCNVEQAQVPSLGVGSSVTVCFPYSTADDIVMKVVAINKCEDGKTALVFRSTEMSPDIAVMRTEKAVLRVESYTGYRVEKSAIRFVDGEQGVYVLFGNIVNFRKITTVYQDENIALAYNKDGIAGHLRLYDEIITEGTDLYDGKIID